MAEDLRKSRVFFRVRVAVLLVVLALVVAWGIKDMRSRRERVEWTHTLDVALVLVSQEDVDASSVAALRERSSTLDAHLADEMRRYRPGAPRPFAFSVYGPVPAAGAPPRLEDDGVISLAQHAWAMWRYYGDVDKRAEVASNAFDARIYLLLKAPRDIKRAFVEGASEQGGRIGTVEVELGPGTVDQALIVAAHELGHTLGASDHYVGEHTLVPAGLAEPDLVPQIPQRFVELMARTRPTSAGEVGPEALVDVAVGPATAREIGWVQ